MISKKLINYFPTLHPRDGTSVFRRYVDAHQEEMDAIDASLEAVKDSRQIDNATGRDLDEIGKLFGELGKRRGRNDVTYRQFLKSLVQSFSGRGTVDGIRFAVAAGLTTDVSTVELTEDFTNLEYSLRIKDWTAHDLSTINLLADLADPSAVKLASVVYEGDGATAIVSAPGTQFSSALGLGAGTLGDGNVS